jgi:ArsR family transcriptional regulator
MNTIKIFKLFRQYLKLVARILAGYFELTGLTDLLSSRRMSLMKKNTPVPKKSAATKITAISAENSDQVFELAAELFRVVSAPMRLKIINCLRDGEQNVSYLLSKIDTTQPNMSQHLNTLYKARVLGKRREGVQIYYRIIDQRIAALCRAVCSQIETA